jgi:hypothetical protein
VAADLYDRIAAWQLATFGTRQSVAGAIEHLRRELAEIERDPTDVEECADAFFLLVQIASRFAGADGAAFFAAVEAKLRKNEGRVWVVPASADEPIEHNREGEVAK